MFDLDPETAEIQKKDLLLELTRNSESEVSWYLTCF